MFLSKLNMSRIEESISKLKKFKYHAIGRLELEDAIDNVVSWYGQMLKDAVEGEVYDYGGGSFGLIARWLDMPNEPVFKGGEKVRIIMLKEEKK